jgi:hypothetical protein
MNPASRLTSSPKVANKWSRRTIQLRPCRNTWKWVRQRMIFRRLVHACLVFFPARFEQPFSVLIQPQILRHQRLKSLHFFCSRLDSSAVICTVRMTHFRNVSQSEFVLQQFHTSVQIFQDAKLLHLLESFRCEITHRCRVACTTFTDFDLVSGTSDPIGNVRARQPTHGGLTILPNVATI